MLFGLPDTPLRGREAEIECITEVLRFCRGGGTALITVEGPLGIGKSRLVREAITIAGRIGLNFALTTVNEREGGHPSRACRSPSVAGQPSVIVFDNADHFNNEDINAIISKSSHPVSHIAWILSRRTRAGTPPLDNFLSNPAGRCERIALGPLTVTASLEAAADVLGARPTPELARVLLRAGGHPWRLRKLAEGMLEERSIVVCGQRAELIEDRVPQRLKRHVRRSLLGYPEQFRQMARVAATLGREVSFGQVAAMMRTPPLELLPVLDELMSAGVLVGCGDKLVFSDTLLWQLISDWVPHTVREALWQQAAALGPTDLAPDDRADETADDRPGAAAAEMGQIEGVDAKANTIIWLVCEGQTNQQIAHRLRLSPHTINYHLRKIFRTFAVNSRVELIREVQRRASPAVGLLADGR